MKRYAEHVAVRDLSLRVPKGSVYGLARPQRRRQDDDDPHDPQHHRARRGLDPDLRRSRRTIPTITDRIGYLPEERGLYRKMQVRRVLRFLAELKGVNAQRSGQAHRRMARAASISRRPRRIGGSSKIDELSRGMQQKVQFIGTLLHDPDLVILDEPFSGLDPINAQALKDTIVELKQRGKTVIFSTHLMDNAERICDSVCIIARGEKVLDGADRRRSRNRTARATSRSRSTERRRHAGHGRCSAISRWCSRVDDSNRYFEIEMAPGADPQELLQRIVETGASINSVRDGAAVAASDFPRERRREAESKMGMTGHG